MPIQNRDYYGAAQRGRVDALDERAMQQRNALGRLQVGQAQQFNALAKNPQATADQYARIGRSDVANYMVGRENAESEQKKQSAKFLFQAAQYGLSSPRPKQFIEQNYPQLAQMYGPDWATATDDDVKAGLQDALGRFGPMAGEAPPQPKGHGTLLYKYLDDQGKPVYGDASTAMGKSPYEKPSHGISMTTPDGTEVQIGGNGVPNYGGVGLTKPNANKLQEAFINAQGNAYALREQMAKYKPEFSTLGGRFKAGVANLKEQVGMENAPQQQQYLADFTSWKADTLALLSQYLHQLSGAAISEHELVRLKGGFPNPDDGPSEYKAKADATMRRFALVQARAAYLLSNPAQSMDSISLDRMSTIIAAEANKLAQSLERGGMTREQAEREAIAKTRARFGMD